MKAVAHHTTERWVVLYVKRWLVAPMQMPDGTLQERENGTPQGSPITPCWPTCSCIMRSIRGWTGSSRAALRALRGRHAAHCVTEDQARRCGPRIA